MSAPVPLLELVAGGTSADEGSPGASVIVLHGLGADGSDFLPMIPALDLTGLGPVRFVLPSAPARPITINGGYVMRAWYDILEPAEGDPLAPRAEDEAGLRASAAIVRGLIEREERRGVPARRIVLMGFSQGCAMALLTGLRFERRLAGLVALSGYLPLAQTTADEASAANRDVPVLMAHGAHDDIVAPVRGQAARDLLRDLGYEVEWVTYPMGHEVCMDEVVRIGGWLRRVLAPR
jgi:phospholipase/carboxylesterase